jgi:hypothetical protein
MLSTNKVKTTSPQEAVRDNTFLNWFFSIIKDVIAVEPDVIINISIDVINNEKKFAPNEVDVFKIQEPNPIPKPDNLLSDTWGPSDKMYFVYEHYYGKQTKFLRHSGHIASFLPLNKMAVVIHSRLELIRELLKQADDTITSNEYLALVDYLEHMHASVNCNTSYTSLNELLHININNLAKDYVKTTNRSKELSLKRRIDTRTEERLNKIQRFVQRYDEYTLKLENDLIRVVN